MMQHKSETVLLQVEICSMDRPPVFLEALQLSLEGGHGPFTILPGHAPLLSTLDIGVMSLLRPDGERIYYAINGGVVQVKDNHILILPQGYEEGREIDLERAEKVRLKAETALNDEHPSDIERMEVVLKRAIARIRARSGSDRML
ncbi:MAG: ATP synthase F1 subunit epsilon [Candidatus Hydrogenedens sp.]|jgi:F-type H+-transporting ATPase subunit epsilon|nr:ATP synthase F1 subunit epsilon [Candidatus Hydrogenedens sp.]